MPCQSEGEKNPGMMIRIIQLHKSFPWKFKFGCGLMACTEPHSSSNEVTFLYVGEGGAICAHSPFQCSPHFASCAIAEAPLTAKK